MGGNILLYHHDTILAFDLLCPDKILDVVDHLYPDILLVLDRF